MNHVMKLNFSGLRTPAQVAEKWLEMRLAVQLPYQQKVDDAIMSTWSVESHQEVSESPGINVPPMLCCTETGGVYLNTSPNFSHNGHAVSGEQIATFFHSAPFINLHLYLQTGQCFFWGFISKTSSFQTKEVGCINFCRFSLFTAAAHFL